MEDGGRALVLRADLRDPVAPRQLVDAAEANLGPVEVLVSNAGLGRRQSLEEVSGDDFDEMVAVNLRAPFLLAQRTLPAMRERGFGRVLFMSSVAAFTTKTPDDAHLDWLSEQYPDTFDTHHRPTWEKHQRVEAGGRRMFFQGLPQQCQVCQLAISFTEKDDPGKVSFRRSEFRGETFHTCSDGCKWIFDREPEKYVQAWLPVHQILKGDCGGPTIPDVLAWYGIQTGDNGEYTGSPDEQFWRAWHDPSLKHGE